MAKEESWTQLEIEYLKSVWGDMSIDVKDIEYKLNRKRQTISAKARRIGLSRGYNSVFSIEEIELLKTYYPIMSAKELKAKFFNNKTEEQIRNAGRNHKILKDKHYKNKIKVETAMNNLLYIEIKSGENHHCWIERVETVCYYCGITIKKLESRLSNTNFCSKECVNKSKIELFKGENNPKWNGGYTDLIKFGRSCLTEWKKDSMKNCGCKCIISGDKDFHIHHIKSYYDIFYEVINEINIEFKDRVYSDFTSEELDLFSNAIIQKHYKYGLGVCMSKDLHNKFHSLYGRIGFTDNDWQEFIKAEIM